MTDPVVFHVQQTTERPAGLRTWQLLVGLCLVLLVLANGFTAYNTIQNRRVIDRLDAADNGRARDLQTQQAAAARLAEQAVRDLLAQLESREVARDQDSIRRLNELLTLITAELRDPRNTERRDPPRLTPNPTPAARPSPPSSTRDRSTATPRPPGTGTPTAGPTPRPSPTPLVCRVPLLCQIGA